MNNNDRLYRFGTVRYLFAPIRSFLFSPFSVRTGRVMAKSLFVLSLILIHFHPSRAQVFVPLSFETYWQEVVAGNLGYAVEKTNVSAIASEALAAKRFQNPQLTIDYGYNEDRKLKMGKSLEVGISQTVSFGKRGSRIALAKSEQRLAETLLADYLKNLGAEAAKLYLEADKKAKLNEIKKNTYRKMLSLQSADSLSFVAGKITSQEVIQNRSETFLLRHEWMEAEAAFFNECLSLSKIMGKVSSDTIYIPRGTVSVSDKAYILSELIDVALTNRVDLDAALKNSDVAKRALSVVKKEKMPDIDFSFSVGWNSRVRNEEAPAPPFRGITAGIAIPLQFSAFNKGAERAAQSRVEQTRLQYEQVRLQVQTEVMTAFREYQSWSERLQSYEKDILSESLELLNEQKVAFENGGISLSDFLNAQRAYDNIQAQYVETLYSYFAALIEMERVSGIWNCERLSLID